MSSPLDPLQDAITPQTTIAYCKDHELALRGTHTKTTSTPSYHLLHNQSNRAWENPGQDWSQMDRDGIIGSTGAEVHGLTTRPSATSPHHRLRAPGTVRIPRCSERSERGPPTANNRVKSNAIRRAILHASKPRKRHHVKSRKNERASPRAQSQFSPPQPLLQDLSDHTSNHLKILCRRRNEAPKVSSRERDPAKSIIPEATINTTQRRGDTEEPRTKINHF